DVYELSLTIVQIEGLCVVFAAEGDASGSLRGSGLRLLLFSLAARRNNRERERGGYRGAGRDQGSPVVLHTDLRSNAGSVRYDDQQFCGHAETSLPFGSVIVRRSPQAEPSRARLASNVTGLP